MSNLAKQLNVPFDTSAPEKKTGIVSGAAIQALTSPYWSGGYKQDTHVVDSVTIDGNDAVGICSMSEYFISPTDPKFHLSIFNATDFLCQVGIIHVLFLNDYKQKTMEVLMTDIQFNLTRQLSDPKEIPFKMSIFAKSVAAPSQKRKTARTFYRWKFDVANGAWWGTVSLCFPFEGK